MPRLELPAVPRSAAAVAPLLFAMLVVASVGAFFVTTRLKRSTPVVQRLTFHRYVSPNGDGRNDAVRISFRTKKRDEVSVTVVSNDGDEVRALARDRDLGAGPHFFRWNGRLAGGAPAPDGKYRVRVALRHQARSVTSPRKLIVDTTPPTPVVRFVSPDSISPDGAGGANHARIRFDGPTRVAPELLVYRTDLPRPRLVARRRGTRGSEELAWDGLAGPSGRGRPAASGNYAMAVRTQDAAGNLGPTEPPERGRFSGHPGLVVSYVSATAPQGPVHAGRPARFAIQTDGRRYSWNVRRLGSARVAAHGRSRAPTLHVHAPSGRSGVFLISIRVGSHRFATPFAVQASRSRRVLVVLPATTWQARNARDVDGDGFADTLPEQRSAALRRPFARSGLPSGFTVREAPLLGFLDRSSLRYDLTTDLALTGGSARPPIRYSGLLFAAPPRFFSRDVGRLVRSYVEAGGRVAWLGAEGFTAPVTLKPDAIASLSPPGSRNLFGEVVRPGGGELTVLGDRIEFFGGAGAALGAFPILEETIRLPRDARLLASAGRDSRRPAVVVYRDGKGVVARVGVEGFLRAPAGSAVPERIMRRLWTLLSR